MNTQTEPNPGSRENSSREIFAGVWISTAVVATFVITAVLNGVFPIFTLVLLVVPLAVLLRTRDATRIGFRSIC